MYIRAIHWRVPKSALSFADTPLAFMFSYNDLVLLAPLLGIDTIPTMLTTDFIATGVSTDTRTLQSGDLFVALRGETFDAHTLLPQAMERGASCLIVESVPDNIAEKILCLVVPNTLKALAILARYHRERFNIPVIAIAGSAGKTSTKELVASVVSQKYHTLNTEGNFNNQIGVPLTLLRLRKEHQCAVIEIGTNEPGEIEILCTITKPTHGVITNIGKEHLEKLIDLDGVEYEETALFRYLTEHEGCACINCDDERLVRHVVPHSIGYTLHHPTLKLSHIDTMICAMAHINEYGLPQVEAKIESEYSATTISLNVQAPGMSSAYNALAATAVGVALNILPEAIARGVKEYKPQVGHSGYGRLVIEHRQGYTLLNDCYNANPLSMYSAIATLKELPAQGKRIALLGDMRELGTTSFTEHCTLLQTLHDDTSIDHIVVIGKEMARAIEHIQSARIALCAEYAECVASIQPLLHDGAVLLVKGSRGIALEHVIGQLH